MQWSCPAARKPWVLQSPAAFLWQCFHALCELLKVFFFALMGATWRVQRGWKITGPCHKTGSSLSTEEKDRQTSANLQPKSVNRCIVVLCSLLCCVHCWVCPVSFVCCNFQFWLFGVQSVSPSICFLILVIFVSRDHFDESRSILRARLPACSPFFVFFVVFLFEKHAGTPVQT